MLRSCLDVAAPCGIGTRWHSDNGAAFGTSQRMDQASAGTLAPSLRDVASSRCTEAIAVKLHLARRTPRRRSFPRRVASTCRPRGRRLYAVLSAAVQGYRGIRVCGCGTSVALAANAMRILSTFLGVCFVLLVLQRSVAASPAEPAPAPQDNAAAGQL